MKIYVVQEGEYSDRHIVGVYTNKEQARLNSLAYFNRDMEEYEANASVVNVSKRMFLLVKYRYTDGIIVKATLCSGVRWLRLDDDNPGIAFVAVDLDNDRLYKSVIRYGKRSGLLKKIVQDKFAELLGRYEMSKDELYEEHKRKYYEEFNRKYGKYIGMFCSSSSSFTLDGNREDRNELQL